ncbi:MAG TPA: spore coat associated protein CotJA [Candidatus Blautia intestinigallinarum]|nr:spore coat associated protein CotJA [Candidatus Blautia intestinigallinarum]
MPVAMAYVPIQKYEKPYELSYALCVGTIFPALCKPFCGRRGIG